MAYNFFSRSHIKILNNFVTCSRFSFRFDVLMQALFSSTDAASSAILGCFGYQIPSVSVTIFRSNSIKPPLVTRKNETSNSFVDGNNQNQVNFRSKNCRCDFSAFLQWISWQNHLEPCYLKTARSRNTQIWHHHHQRSYWCS